MKKEVKEENFIAYKGENIFDIKKFYGIYDKKTIDEFIYDLLEEIDEDISSCDEEVQEINEQLFDDAYRSYENGNYLLDTKNFTDLYNEYFYLDNHEEVNITKIYKN